ncbi:uncharacterized protein LOC122562423 [Chiloscyllium plagiosum]|uniref:uncharacterized protein LOC122562423 n=1 Tax=Chiloscyllium plagiosum TaxID=36176 RepID=UPI001CB7D3C0|nr:uncharacterized protein LOC122562423 [Chiloscyllium plagiosum]
MEEVAAVLELELKLKLELRPGGRGTLLTGPDPRSLLPSLRPLHSLPLPPGKGTTIGSISRGERATKTLGNMSPPFFLCATLSCVPAFNLLFSLCACSFGDRSLPIPVLLVSTVPQTAVYGVGATVSSNVEACDQVIFVGLWFWSQMEESPSCFGWSWRGFFLLKSVVRGSFHVVLLRCAKQCNIKRALADSKFHFQTPPPKKNPPFLFQIEGRNKPSATTM